MELLRELKSLLAFNSMMRHSFFKRIVSIMLIIVALASTCSCSTSDADATAVSTPSYYQYLGDEAYDSSISAFVCESIEGEEEKGIIYREVTDLNGRKILSIKNQKDINVSSLKSGVYIGTLISEMGKDSKKFIIE